jgi:hypothetical protein
MKLDASAAAAAAIFAVMGTAAWATEPPTSGPAVGRTPAWHMRGSHRDPGGRTIVEPGGKVTMPPGSTDRGDRGANLRPCRNSPVCGNRVARTERQRVTFEETMGYTASYPISLPPGFGGVPAVSVDSKDNVWVFQRKAAGMPQLFKYTQDGRLLLAVGDDVISHNQKAHDMVVDPDDNAWVIDNGDAVIRKVSADGKLLMTLGRPGRAGDWNEETGSRLLWQPVAIAFAANGEIFIGEGHANESPNDADSGDPYNNIGAARVIRLDRTGKFITQWYGNSGGPGKFDSSHGLAIDPKTGDVWIGDREQYRIVVYNADGKFLRTMQMRNLVCGLMFDRNGEPWMSSGQDGQYLKLTRDGQVVGAVGKGMGIEAGQFVEAGYWGFDSSGAIWAGDTSVGRVTKFSPPPAAPRPVAASARSPTAGGPQGSDQARRL